MLGTTRKSDRHSILRTACEPLEQRMMLCALDIHDDPRAIEPVYEVSEQASSRTSGGPQEANIDIIWVNRGVTSGINNDRFNDVFGANALAARAVVDAVIDAWERVISSFNYSGGAPDVYSLYVKMDSAGASLGGVGSVSHYNNGKPDIGHVTIGRGLDTTGDGLGDGGDWFIDPTPNENSEFLGNIANPYAGDAQGGSPAVGLSDLYTVVAAEMTHCMGLIGGNNDFQNSGFLSSTSVSDTAEGGGVGDFWTFVGPTISHLMTSNTGGPTGTDVGTAIHTAGPGVPVGVIPTGVFMGADDAGNAGYETGRRYLISNTVRLILDDAYGYDTVNPEEFGTFHAVLNESTGQVTVRGGNGTSADNIDISVDGGDVVIAVDVGNDIDGTGTTPGTATLNSFITRYPAADVDSIVVDSGSGADVINLWGCESPVTVNGGFGNDTINVGDDDIDSNLLADVQANGGGDVDRLNFDDRLDGPLSDIYLLTSTQLVKAPLGSNRRITYASMESVQLSGSDQNSRYDIFGVPAGTTFVTFAGSGNDTFNIADGDIDLDFGANVTVNGGNGVDDIVFRDTTDGPGGDSYDLITGRLTKGAATVDRRVNFNGMESLQLQGSNQPSSYTISALAANLPATINAGSASDTIGIAGGDIDADILSNMTITGNGGDDAITFDDSSDNAGADEYTVTQQLFSKDVRNFRYNTIEAINLTGSPQDDEFHINGTAAGTVFTLASGTGTDTFVLGFNDLGSVLTAVSLQGQGGTDSLIINDLLDAQDDTYTLTNTTFSKTLINNVTRQFAQYSGMEELALFANGDDNLIDVVSTPANTAVTVFGNDGNDVINVGSGRWDGAVRGPVEVIGDDGDDTLRIDDSSDTGVDTYLVTSTKTTSTGALAGSITYSTIESYRLDANGDANQIDVNGTFDGQVLIRGNGGADTINIIDNFAGTFVRIDGGPDLDNVRVNSDAIGTAAAEFSNAQDLQLLRVLNGGSARVSPGGDHLIATRELELPGNGTLDLADNDMIVDYTGVSPLSTIRAALSNGYTGGAWTGTGINSSTAAADATHLTGVGYAEAADVLGASGGTFSGINVDNTSILVKYTWYGDADLTGAVDIADLGRLATNWQQSGRNWAQGNFDYNAARIVDVNDLGLLATNWQAGVGSPLAPRAARESFRSAWENLMS
jgi:hypothetical protein